MERRRFGSCLAVLIGSLVVALSGCATTGSPPATLAIATPVPIVDASAEPILETPEPVSPTSDPAELAAAAEERAATEQWVNEVNHVEPPIAAAFAEVVAAYAGGTDFERSGAVSAWIEAMKAAGRGSLRDHDQCWGRVAEVYDDAFRDMGRVADDLATSLLPGLSPSLNPSAEARLALRALEASYHPEFAGKLDADAIERLCAVSPDPASPIPAPEGSVTDDGLRFGEPTVSGRWASALVENTTDQAIGLGGTGLRFFDAKGQPIKGVYVGHLMRVIGPHQTGVVEFAGAKEAPKGWKSARIDPPDPSTGPYDADLPLTASAPTSATTSLGMFVAVQVGNSSDKTWCASVAAVAVRDGRAVASGHQDGDCAPTSGWEPSDSWPEVVRLFGDTQLGDRAYVELMFAGPK
jgi:hypothetical protein